MAGTKCNWNAVYLSLYIWNNDFFASIEDAGKTYTPEMLFSGKKTTKFYRVLDKKKQSSYTAKGKVLKWIKTCLQDRK